MTIKLNWKELGKVLIVIDAANLESSAKDMGVRIRYKKLRDFFVSKVDIYKIIFFSARFCTESHNNFLTFLKKQNFKLMTKSLKIINDKGTDKRKANFDVEITAVVMENINFFDSLILFSGDSDFEYLIKLLKNKNKYVIVISSRHHISRELIESSTKYIDLKKFKSIFGLN